jgi:hypothetical protein
MRKRRFGKTRSWATVTATAGLLAACAAGSGKITSYSVPEGVPTARLLIRPTLATNMAFTVLTFEDGQGCSRPQRLNKPEAGHNNQSTAVRAGELTTLMFVGEYRKEYCASYFSFLPKPGHTYLLATYQDANACAVRLLDASNGDTPTPEKSFVKLAKKGNACVPADAAQAGTANPAGSATAPKATANPLSDFKDLLPAQ